MSGRFALVLHSHIPYVLGHGRWPHGTDWICEAVAEAYLPLLAALERLERDRVPARLTLTLSPVLCEQLADAAFRAEFDLWLRTRHEQLERDAESFAREGNGAAAELARQWIEWVADTRKRYEAIDGNVLAAFRGFEERGRLELGTCAATHGYLPLLSREESVQIQIKAALASFERHIGHAPKGFWLPECAYRPRYEWTPPIGRNSGKYRAVRQGLEEVIASHGLSYFFADAHLALAGDPLSIYRNFYPNLATLRGFEERFPQNPKIRNPFRPVRVQSRGAARSAAALLREPRTALQVWSGDEGYPGDASYLDFHRRSVANGIRYHRVTGPGVPDAKKVLYEPDKAKARVEEHARHFVWLLGDVVANAKEAGETDPLVCSPYDTELFGHWWFEGPLFLEHLFRHLADSGIAAVSASDELAGRAEIESTSLLEGSWGEGGDHRAWLNKDTEWTWDRLYDAESDLAAVVALWRRAKDDGSIVGDVTLVERGLRQAMRELLLLQSSDWQFLIATGAAFDYAERRFATHYVELKRSLDLVRRNLANAEPGENDLLYLGTIERVDSPFPNLQIDWYSPPRD